MHGFAAAAGRVPCGHAACRVGGQRALDLAVPFREPRHDERDPRGGRHLEARARPRDSRCGARRARRRGARARRCACVRARARTRREQPPRSSRSSSARCRGVESSAPRRSLAAARCSPRPGSRRAIYAWSIQPRRRARCDSARHQSKNAAKSCCSGLARSRSRSIRQWHSKRQASAAHWRRRPCRASSAPSSDSAITRRQSASDCGGVSAGLAWIRRRSQRCSSQARVADDRRSDPSAPARRDRLGERWSSHWCAASPSGTTIVDRSLKSGSVPDEDTYKSAI